MSAIHPLWSRFITSGLCMALHHPERFTRWVELFELSTDSIVAPGDPLLSLAIEAFDHRPIIDEDDNS